MAHRVGRCPGRRTHPELPAQPSSAPELAAPPRWPDLRGAESTAPQRRPTERRGPCPDRPPATPAPARLHRRVGRRGTRRPPRRRRLRRHAHHRDRRPRRLVPPRRALPSAERGQHQRHHVDTPAHQGAWPDRTSGNRFTHSIDRCGPHDHRPARCRPRRGAGRTVRVRASSTSRLEASFAVLGPRRDRGVRRRLRLCGRSRWIRRTAGEPGVGLRGGMGSPLLALGRQR